MNSEKQETRVIPYRFQPGESGNPNGRPKGTGGKTFKSILNDLLDKVVTNENILSASEIVEMYPDRKLTYRQAMMVRMLAQAIVDPESRSAQRIMNQVDGLPTQNINHSGQITEIVVNKNVIRKNV